MARLLYVSSAKLNQTLILFLGRYFVDVVNNWLLSKGG